MSFSAFKSKHAFALAILVSALLILRQYIDYLINDFGYEFSWFAVSARITINYLVWAIFFWILLKVGQHFQVRAISFKSTFYHICISLLFSAAHRLASVRLYDFAYYGYSGFLRDFITPGNKVAIGAGLFSSFLEYWIIMMLIVGILYYSRYAEQQKELNDAKLNALKMQLQPHFLFNTLNSITSLIDINPKKAQKMLTQLGFLMRELLENDKKHFISLESELAYIKSYLEIEHIRFQDRLSLQFDIDEETLCGQVPALLLQPIVENAIKHGIAKNPDGGVIVVKSRVSTGNGMAILTLSVANDMPKINGNHQGEGYGIGTKNVSRRLRQLYGAKHTYTQTSISEKYITEITLPFQPI
jgi:two-component system, LytTR family, sensor kinase